MDELIHALGMAKGGARPKSSSGGLGIFGSLKKKLGFGSKNESDMQQQQEEEVQVMQQQQQFPVMQQQQAYGYDSEEEKEEDKHRQGMVTDFITTLEYLN